MSKRDDELWAAYQRTHVTVRLGLRKRLTVCAAPHTVASSLYPFVSAGPGRDYVYILTACNPESRPLSEQENHSRHVALGKQLSRLNLPVFPTVGRDPENPEWEEPGYAVVGLPDSVAFRFAQQWQQNALFVWDRERWILASVLLPPRRLVTGWTATSDTRTGSRFLRQ